jgi:hypothetical protein
LCAAAALINKKHETKQYLLDTLALLDAHALQGWIWWSGAAPREVRPHFKNLMLRVKSKEDLKLV